MVNGNVDKNNTSTNSNPDEESAEQEGDCLASSMDTTASSSRKSSDADPSSDNHKKVDVGDGEAGSRAMAEVSTKIGLFCNVPLNKIRLSSEEESSSKIKQVSRKLLCLYCDRSFVSSNLRQKHVERCHSEKQNRRLSSRKLQSQFTTTACFHCDKLPVEHSLRQLFEHLVSAHSQKYFGCLLCEERFLNQIHLNDHNTKLHNLPQKEHQKVHLVNIDDESKNEANRTSESTTEDSKGKEQKSTKNNAKKKKTTANAKPPPRQLRNRKKVTVKTSKVGLKRSKRLQSAQNKVPVRKKKTKAMESSKSDENTSKTTDKAKTSAVNPYPEFDNYYRVKKITDHSIDNLKISSLTFDDVFDKAFFNRIKCNIQENLLYHLDGKLFKNEESESRISNFEKNPPTQEISSNSSENFGCDLSLNAVTPVTSILTSNFGEDLESQIEYGSKPSKKKLQIRQDPVRHKYVTRRKYQASILEHKENRDLSKLDMWTQLIIKDRQQKVLNGQKSAKEILEYTTCAEYKLKIQRNELNRILDRRGPFEDLKEEASKKAALEQLNSDSDNEISEECFKEVRILMEELLSKVAKNCLDDQDESSNIIKLDEKADFLDKEDIPELPDYLKLRRKSSAPSEDEIDKSDRIALICSSQETENYELPTNTVRSKDEMVELSGEWARSRIYVCAACGLKVPNMKLLIDHKSIYHQNSWVQHYELVGNQSELYRHLCIPGLGKVGQVEETIPCKSWLKSESRVCTKCGKVCNSLSELHRHILECGGDWTWMLARKKCKYRPFGARKKRRGLVKRIRVSNQKTDQTEKKKYKKTFDGPRQRPSDADTIQRMLANLPPKRSSRKSICMKDGFPRNRQKSPKNKKQVMKCGKIVRHKSTYDTNVETAKKPSNHKNASIRHTVRSISRTLSSKILDTNSKLKVKRQLIQKINRRSPRKTSQNVLETTDEANKNEKTEEKRPNIKKNINNGKTKKEGDLDRMKRILKEKVNMKTFFPVSKRKASKNPTKLAENLNSDTSQQSLNIEVKNDTDSSKDKAAKNVINLIKKSLNITKKVKVNSKNDANISGNSEPIVVIEKLPQEHQTEMKPTLAAKKGPTKRKLRSSFRKVIDKVKKLKLDSTTSSIPNEKNQETTRKPVNSFLGHGAREKEKLATVLVPLVEELKENPPSNLAFVQNAMDNNSPTEESLIPENIFNLQHNSEDLLQAKSPLDTITNELKKNETINYFSTMSAKVSNLPESKTGTDKKAAVIESGSNATTPNQNSAISPKEEAPQVKGMSQLTIETAAKSDKSPLVSPVLSPSMLSPKLKGKIRKPNRGLNDCIAMLTKKAFEETHKSEVVSDLEQTTENTKLDNTNEAHKIIRANECILKIPVIETNSSILSEVLDLSKPKKCQDASTRENTMDLLSPKPTPVWNPVNEMCNSQKSVKDSKIIWQKSTPNAVVNSSLEKAILKIPKFIEISRSNNVDNIIQGVIENYDKPDTKADMTKSYLKVPSVGLLTSVDRVIEEVVRGNSTCSSNESISIQKTESAADRKGLPKDNNIVPQHTSSKSKKGTKKNKQSNNSLTIEKIISANVSCLGEGANEVENQQNDTCGKLNIPQIVVTPSIDSVVSGSPVKSIDLNYPGSSLESPSLKESTFKEESKANDTLDGKIIPTDSDIVAMKNDSVSPVCTTVKKKTGKKMVTKRTSKKSSGTSKDKLAESKLEEYDVEKIELNLQTHDILPIFPQTNEPEILEEKQIPVNDNKIIAACTNILPIQSCNGGNQLSSEAVAETESQELQGEQNEVANDLEENSKNHISILEQIEITEEKNKTIIVDSSAATVPNVSNSEVVVSEKKEENDLKANLTDSEDELPLLVLKSRSKKGELKGMSEASAENTTETSTSSKYQTKNIEEYDQEKAEACRAESIEKTSDENTEQREEGNTEIFEYKLAGKSVKENNEQHKEENTEILDDESLKVTESSVVANPPNKLLTDDEEHLDAAQCSSMAESESNFKQGEDRRKSARKISVDTKLRKNGKKSNKQKQSSKHKVGRGLEETISEVNATENKGQPEKNCVNTSDEVLLNDVPAEKSSVLKPLDTVVIDTHKKSKNFLVDASAPNFKNSVMNSPLFSMKSSKNKKKDKNKHDSVKTKLIFKFPKIILKEPVLRIPPRDISESTSFVNKTESSQDNGIKLILDNPFSSIKDREATKILSLTNKPDVPGKSTDHLATPKLKTPNKKKGSKHKKKSSKSSVKGDEKEVANEIQHNSLEDTNTSPQSSLAINKDLFPAQDNKTVVDDFDIPLISPDSTSILQDISRSADHKDETNESSNVIQPITLKLQASSLKKCASRNSRKKKNKLTKPNFSPIASELDDKTEKNYFPSSEESEMASIEKILPEIRETKELPTHDVKEIEEAEKKSPNTKLDTIEPSGSENITSKLQGDNLSGEQPTTDKNSISNLGMENKECIPVKSGRSLRSTVKITYKQSNIFALQIEDKEISDLKIMEIPKNFDIKNGSCNEMLLPDEKKLKAVVESHNSQHKDFISKEVPDYASFQSDIKTSSDKKFITELDYHQKQLQKEDTEETAIDSSSISFKKASAEEHDDLSVNYSKLNSLNTVKPDAEIEMPATKSKKNKRASKTKKVSNKISDFKMDTNYCEFSEEKVTSPFVTATIIETNISHEVLDIQTKTQSSNGSFFQTESVVQEESPLKTHEEEPIEDLLALAKYEDSSFSEGELVINESFENQETNILEEFNVAESTFETCSTEINNLPEEKEETILDTECSVMEQKKSEKNKKNKKGKRPKSKEIPHTENHCLKTIESFNSNESSSPKTNDYPQNKELCEKVESTVSMNKLEDIDSELNDAIKNLYQDSLSVNLAPKKKDEFEFEEDALPICDLAPKFKKKKLDVVERQDNLMDSIPLCKEKQESASSSIPQFDIDLQDLPLDSSTVRRQRSAKSRALENINIIEKKLDQILDIDVSAKPNSHKEKSSVHPSNKKKFVKYKEAITENTILKDTIKWTPKDIPTEENNIKDAPHRKGRAAKSKAIQNIKVLETKTDDIEDIAENVKKSHNTDENEKLKRIGKFKDKCVPQIESNENMINNHFTEKNSRKEKTSKKENKTLDARLLPLSSSPIDTSFSKIKEVLKSANKKIVKELNNIQRYPWVQGESEVNKLEGNDSVCEGSKKTDETSSLEKDESNKFKSTREKIGYENDRPKTNSEMESMKNSTSEIGDYYLENLFSDRIPTGEKSDNHRKQKMKDNLGGPFDTPNGKDKTDCYDIANIDEDNNLEDQVSTSLSPSKKPTKNRQLHCDEIKENHLKLSEDSPIAKNRGDKVLEHIHNIPQITDVTTTDLIDSLDVTLKTTVDEISSILMEKRDEPEINFGETKRLQTTKPNESRKHRNGKKPSNDEDKSSRIFEENPDKAYKKKRNRDSSLEESKIGNEKVQNLEMITSLEMESKRRSKRACKVNTYNENELAEAIFEQAASEKEKSKKKRADEVINDSSCSATAKKITACEVSTGKKLNTDELFDLLKTTAPDNLIALKPVEESPSNTPITDDTFDDEFDDILRKSQALFGEKPYKKLDDICRSDDSSYTSKLTDFERSEDNTESNDLLKKSAHNYIDDSTFNNSVSSMGKSQTDKSEEIPTSQSDDLYCDICKKSFKRIDNLIKHRTTLTHIAKLSEIEAREAQNKLRAEVQINDDSSYSNVDIDCQKQISSRGYSYPSNTGNDALKIAEIITKALEKPAPHADRGFSEVINPLPEYRRCKSLGERKSFEYDQDSPNISENIDANHYEPKISKNTGVILEKQINLLQNIVGLDYINDASTSSFRSLGNSVTSPISEVSTKLEDSTNHVFPIDLDRETGRTCKIEGFLKPPQIEDISEDSVNPRNSEDIKSRKVLNRDEELFLECCSLLKSGSEVSNFSKKSNRNSFLNNIPIRMSEEPDVLESKNVVYKIAENSSDYSRRATPLGDSFGDTSNSNTISSSWEMNKNDQLRKNQENFFNFGDTEKKVGVDQSCFDSSMTKSSLPTDTSTNPSNTKQRKSNLAVKHSKKGNSNFNKSSSKMPTKGAKKIFEGLKVSIQASEMKLDSLKKNMSLKKQENNGSEKPQNENKFVSPKSPRRKSKPVKNKPQIDDRFIFKVNKKTSLKDAEETILTSSKETITDKVSDVYDFEETQDNTDVFAKPDFKTFRTKGTDAMKEENTLENNYEAQTMSSSSSSNLSCKKAKSNECITKKKHMIMGRIFKNAVKPKLDEEIRDIPAIDHNELVENYVMNCTPKNEEEEFKKPKMTEEEMNYLFDKLLDKPAESPKKSCNTNRTDKNNGTKKKLKTKCKKRHRSNSDSTDDEFGLNRIVKKRPGRKNAKEEDNSINLEQELKECIGVASRKSQRKCTSGKQNVLVEYWSSDESAFETFLENHLQELSEKSDLPNSKDAKEKQEENSKIPSINIPKENPSKNSSCEKSKKSKSRVPKKKEIKESTASNEVSETLSQSNRRKRTAAHPLYHWSSSSEDELQDMIEVKSVRDDPEDEYDEERPVQHGWIVGDSPKKLVTMLAQAKGKKTEPESLVKEQGKKKNSNS